MIDINLPNECARLNDYFKDFVGLRIAKSWREYWMDKKIEYLDQYLKMGWYVFPLPRHQKRPFGGFNWSGVGWRRDTLLDNLKNGGNIAVVAGLCQKPLVIIDCDSISDFADYGFLPETMTQRTARGVQFFTTEPFNERLGTKLKKTFPTIDSFRTQVMYALIPLSETCMNDSQDGCSGKDHQHDFRVRDWLYRDNLMTFSDFAKAIL